MNCLKCGREIQSEDVFCPECLEIMAANPVNPRESAQIYPRPDVRRNPVRKPRKSEDIIQDLKKSLYQARMFCLVMSLLWFFTACALGYFLWVDGEELDLGFNYSTFDSWEGGR